MRMRRQVGTEVNPSGQQVPSLSQTEFDLVNTTSRRREVEPELRMRHQERAGPLASCGREIVEMKEFPAAGRTADLGKNARRGDV